MDFYKYVNEFAASDLVRGVYLMDAAAVKTARNGKPYLDLTLSDCTGKIPGKAWNYTGSLNSESAGTPVYVEGAVSEFQGALQFTCDQIRVAEGSDNIDKARLVPVAPIDADAAWGELMGIVDGIQDPVYRCVTERLLRKHEAEFTAAPAAKGVHHAFLHGLLMHTRDMAWMALKAASIYGDVVNRDLLLAGTILHDIGKLQEYELTDLGLASGFTTAGNLAGHLVLGAMEVRDTCIAIGADSEKSLLLQHMLLAHHGKPEYGAAVEPACPEAEILSMLDMMDARVEVYRNAYKAMEPGTNSTQRVYALGHYVYKAKGEN